MDFNWKGALRGTVTGMNDRYKADQQEQAEFERMEKISNMNMMKQQEMALWSAKQNKQLEQEQHDTGLIRQEAAYGKLQERKESEMDAAETRRKGMLQGQIDEKISMEDQLSDAATEREFKKAEKTVQKLFPELEEGTPEYQQKLRQVAGLKSAEKDLTKKEKSDFMKEASKIVTDRTKDLSEAEVLATHYGSVYPKGVKKGGALGHYRETMKMEIYTDMVTAGTPGPAVDKKANATGQATGQFNPQRDMPILAQMTDPQVKQKIMGLPEDVQMEIMSNLEQYRTPRIAADKKKRKLSVSDQVLDAQMSNTGLMQGF